MSTRRRPRMTRRVLRGFDAQAFTQPRRRKGISVSDLVSPGRCLARPTVFNWEAGNSTPQVDLLARVMRILDVSDRAGRHHPRRASATPATGASSRASLSPSWPPPRRSPPPHLRGIERADIGADRRQRRKAGRTCSVSASRSTAPPSSAPGSAQPALPCDRLCKFSKRVNSIKWQDTTKSATFRAAVARGG